MGYNCNIFLKNSQFVEYAIPGTHNYPSIENKRYMRTGAEEEYDTRGALGMNLPKGRVKKKDIFAKPKKEVGSDSEEEIEITKKKSKKKTQVSTQSKVLFGGDDSEKTPEQIEWEA